MSHFLIPFYGNKGKEYKYIEPFLNFDGIENIIEPFCGSSAISFNIWLKHPHLNFYLNDIDVDLINHYNLIKYNDIDEIYDTINRYKIRYNKPDEYREFAKTANKETPIDPLKYFFMKKASRFRANETLTIDYHNNGNNFPKLTNLKLKFIEFVKSPNVYISNDDWSVLFNKYKNNTNTMFFIDPPYIDSDNTFYNKKAKQEYDDTVYRFFHKNKISSFKSKIFVILELIEKNIEIFGDDDGKDNIINTYDKMYILKKKKTKHAIFSNLNLT